MSEPLALDASTIAAIAAAVADQAPPAPLLTAEQAAEHLSVPASWVLAEARANRIPHLRLGRYVRFDGDALTDWRNARQRGPHR